MPLIPPAPQKTQRELVPEGNHPARIYELIEIGSVEGSWMGQPKTNYNIRVSFEFPTKKFVFSEEKGPQPFVLSREMSFSLSEKANLRKIVEAVEGKKLTDAEAANYDVLQIVGKPLLVTVTHTEPNQEGIQYANATTFSAVIEGLTVAPLYNPVRVLTYGEWDEEVFQSLPDFLKEKIAGTPEYQSMKSLKLPKVEVEIEDDGSVDAKDLPF